MWFPSTGQATLKARGAEEQGNPTVATACANKTPHCGCFRWRWKKPDPETFLSSISFLSRENSQLMLNISPQAWPQGLCTGWASPCNMLPASPTGVIQHKYGVAPHCHPFPDTTALSSRCPRFLALPEPSISSVSHNYPFSSPGHPSNMLGFELGKGSGYV